MLIVKQNPNSAEGNTVESPLLPTLLPQREAQFIVTLYILTEKKSFTKYKMKTKQKQNSGVKIRRFQFC